MADTVRPTQISRVKVRAAGSRLPYSFFKALVFPSKYLGGFGAVTLGTGDHSAETLRALLF